MSLAHNIAAELKDASARARSWDRTYLLDAYPHRNTSATPPRFEIENGLVFGFKVFLHLPRNILASALTSQLTI